MRKDRRLRRGLMSLGLTLLLAFPIFAATNSFNEKSLHQWTLKGDLTDIPQRHSEVLPLSDQQNKGRWIRFEDLWDEFDGRTIETNKWVVGMTWWQGRQPAWFNPTNVQVHDGQLHLTMRKEPVPEQTQLADITITHRPRCTRKSVPAMATTKSKRVQ